MTTPPQTSEIDCLSLLAHKVGPRVFDLSSQQVHVSVRDQMVRAQLLVRDLHQVDPQAQRLLIIGMGAAGMSAAMRACEEGFAQVHVVDVAAQPFALFHGVQARHVGPYMYEWPSPFHWDQSYPAHEATPWGDAGHSPLAWQAAEPIRAADFGMVLLDSFNQWRTKRIENNKSVPHLHTRVPKAAIKKYLKQFVKAQTQHWQQSRHGPVREHTPAFKVPAGAQPWPSDAHPPPPPESFAPDHIIVAVGMGKEVLSLPGSARLRTPPFWANDRLKSPITTRQHVVVLGGGDGAMQDALRALTIFEHPVSFIQHMASHPQVSALLSTELPHLLSADRQMRQHGNWSADTHGLRMVDQACAAAAKRVAQCAAAQALVVRALREGSGHVTLLVREPFFDKAYLLNRFVTHLLAETLAAMRPPLPTPSTKHSSTMGFTLAFNHEVVKFHKGPGRGFCGTLDVRTPGGHITPMNAGLVVVRFGIDKNTVPGLQLVQLTDPSVPGANSRQRTTFKRVELPFVSM